MKAIAFKAVKTITSFSEQEREQLIKLLSSVKGNPFTNYPLFLRNIQKLIVYRRIPKFLLEVCEYNKNRNLEENPCVLLKNCPVDRDLPQLNWEDPRQSKLAQKKTFIGEAFLILYGELMGRRTLAYKYGASGDYIRDVHPQKSLKNSFTSRTLTNFSFHNELGARKVAPDFLQILGLHAAPENEIYTTFINNKELINRLSPQTKAILKRKQFQIGQSLLSVLDGLETKKNYHAVINEGYKIIFHQDTTKALTKEGTKALEELISWLNVGKTKIFIGKGDMVDFSNNHCLHAKEVHRIGNPKEEKHRWLIKTFSTDNVKKYEPYFMKENYGMVNQ